MADVKATSLRTPRGEIAPRAASMPRLDPGPPPAPVRTLQDRPSARPADSGTDAAAALIAEFTTPPPRTQFWLSDPRLGAALQAASEVLAPGGRSEDLADRYAASVIETHLSARRQLAKHMNALLKT